jgi:hypothetical protein
MDSLIGNYCTPYKGGRYQIIGFAKHSEDLSNLVIYRSEVSGETWVRPREMFFEKIVIDGKQVDRFKLDQAD